MQGSIRRFASDDVETPTGGAASSPPLPPHPLLEGKRVLWFDPDAEMLELMSCALGRLGAVVSAHRQVPGMDVLLGWVKRVDCIVSELTLDNGDGYELIAQVRHAVDGARLPALALTTSFNPCDEERALSAGFQSFLRKPVRLEHLEAVLAHLVSAR